MLYFHFTFNICFLIPGTQHPPNSINKSLKFQKYNIPFYKEGLKNDLTIQHLLITDRAFLLLHIVCCTRILIANSGSYLFQIILVVYRYCGEPPIYQIVWKQNKHCRVKEVTTNTVNVYKCKNLGNT